MNSAEQAARKMSQKELVDALVVISRSARNNYKRKTKTSETEINAGLVSRAKGTTLVANSYKATQAFNTDIEQIRILLKYIW